MISAFQSIFSCICFSLLYQDHDFLPTRFLFTEESTSVEQISEEDRNSTSRCNNSIVVRFTKLLCFNDKEGVSRLSPLLPKARFFLLEYHCNRTRYMSVRQHTPKGSSEIRSVDIMRSHNILKKTFITLRMLWSFTCSPVLQSPEHFLLT